MGSTSKVFCVTYKLNGSWQDYSGLCKELEASPDWLRYLKSAWLISTDETAGEVCEKLKPFLHIDDGLLVIEIKPDCDYSGWLEDDAWDWIKRHFDKVNSLPPEVWARQ